MVADIKKLSHALSRETPEQTLNKQIARRGADIKRALGRGESFRLRDVQGRLITISGATPRQLK
jgi:hypothetical protein